MNLETSKRLKTALTFLFIGLLLGGIIVYVYVSSSPATLYISGRIYPNVSSYTIWREGSTYYAKNAYGAIIFSGTNMTTVTQNALDNGNDVVITDGTYILDATISLNSHQSLYGSGFGTILQTSNQMNLINVTGTAGTPKTNVTIANIKLVGSGVLQIGYYVINCRYMEKSIIRNVYVTGAPEDGIHLGRGSYDNIISDIVAVKNEHEGIEITGEVDNEFNSGRNVLANIVSRENGEEAIEIDSAEKITINGLTSYRDMKGLGIYQSRFLTISDVTIVEPQPQSGYGGVELTPAIASYSSLSNIIVIDSTALSYRIIGQNFLTLSNCRSYNSTEEGFYIYGSHYGIFDGLHAIDSGKTGIYFKSGSSVLTNSRIEGSQEHGLHIYQHSWSIISSNVIIDSSQNASNTYSSIYIDGAYYFEFLANQIYNDLGTVKYGIEELNSPNPHLFVGNRIGAGMGTTATSFGMGRHVIALNMGF